MYTTSYFKIFPERQNVMENDAKSAYLLNSLKLHSDGKRVLGAEFTTHCSQQDK